MTPEQIAAAHAQSKSQFQKLTDAQGHLADMQRALSNVAPLGQNVTRQDIMEQIMQLVESGRLSSKEAAVAIGTVPMQGPALAEWVQGHLARYGQMQDQLGSMHEQARKTMMATAVQGLIQSLSGRAGAPQGGNPLNAAPAAPGGANALAGS